MKATPIHIDYCAKLIFFDSEFTRRDYISVASHRNKLVEQYLGNLKAGCTSCSWSCNRCLVATVGMTVQYTVQIKSNRKQKSVYLCINLPNVLYILPEGIVHPKVKFLS